MEATDQDYKNELKTQLGELDGKISSLNLAHEYVGEHIIFKSENTVFQQRINRIWQVLSYQILELTRSSNTLLNYRYIYSTSKL